MMYNHSSFSYGQFQLQQQRLQMEQSLQPFQIGQAQLGLNRGQLEFEQQRKMVPLQDLQTNFSMQKTQYDIGTLPAMAATPCFDSN